MNSSRLGRLAEIRAGITFRGVETNHPAPDGRYTLVRIGDLTDQGEIRAGADFPRLSPAEDYDPKMILRAGDVLFPARGLRTTAAVYRDHPSPPAVVGSQFFVIQPRQDVLHPDYLAWYFTTATARLYFDTRRSGSLVQFVGRTALAEFPLPVPPMETQRRVARLSQLLHREQRLTARLHEQRRLLVETGLLQTLTSSGQ